MELHRHQIFRCHILQSFRIGCKWIIAILALPQKSRLGSLVVVEETMSHGAAGQPSRKRVSSEAAVLLTDPWGSSVFRSIHGPI